VNEHENVQRIRDLYRGIAEGDVATFADLIHPDVVWHFPGSSWMAGTRKGIADVGAMFMELSARTNNRFAPRLRDAVGNGERVVSIVDAHITVDGETFDSPVCVLYEFEGGKVVEVREFIFEAQAGDAFWARHPGP
jgi:ketosteroid isomerase-like protein